MFKSNHRMRGRMPAVRKEREPRIPLTKSATIQIDGRGTAVSCTIRDMNSGGARISTANPSAIIGSVMLVCASDDMCALATVVWHRQTELGLRFGRKGDLASFDTFMPILQRRYDAEMAKRAAQEAERAAAQSAFLAQHQAQTRANMYAALGLDPAYSYTPDQIKQQYRVAAMAAHPDHGGSVEAFQRLGHAYNQLMAELEQTAA